MFIPLEFKNISSYILLNNKMSQNLHFLNWEKRFQIYVMSKKTIKCKTVVKIFYL